MNVPEIEIDTGLARWCETFSAHYVRLLAGADTSHWELGPHAAQAAAAVEHRALDEANVVVADLGELTHALGTLG